MVEEGAVVREGDVLLRLEDREVRNEYEQASIAVDEANLGLRQGEVQGAALRCRLRKIAGPV